MIFRHHSQESKHGYYLHLFTRRIMQAFYSCFTAKFFAKAAPGRKLRGDGGQSVFVEPSAASAKMRLRDRHLSGDLTKIV
jgi:hypothetical protein